MSPRARFEAAAVFLLLVVAALLGAATAGAASAWEPAARAGIQISVATHIDSTGVEAPLVRASVPYGALVFIREGAVFRAAIRLTVIAKHDGRRAGGGVGEAVVTVADYAATRGDQQLACAAPLQLRAGGRTTLEVEILVTGTSRRWRERLEYVAGRGLRVPLYFADFAWNAAVGPNTGAALGPQEDSLRVSVTLARRPNVPDWPPDGVTLAALVAPPGRGDKPAPRRLEVVADGGRRGAPAVIAAGLGRGRPAAGAAGPVAAGSRAATRPRRSGSTSIRRVRSSIWRCAGAKTRSGVSTWPGWRGPCRPKRAPDCCGCPSQSGARRGGRSGRRWRPPPGSPAAELEREHLLRIVAADERFGGLGRGALTDRGRIWVRCGEPDSVEERGADLAYEGRWEIWYYHARHLVFTFYDAHGLGDFRLVASGTL